MMRSLFSGVAGLKGHQTRMDVVGNNIANVNTTGFKSSRVTFADTLNQTVSGASAPGDNIGGTNPKQIGLGVGVASIDLLFTDGSIQSTGKNTDLCLSGNGLFVVKQGNETYYTRDGAFEFDAKGNYVIPANGMKVQGWMGTDGVVSATGAITDITILAGKSMGAQATKKVEYNYNLQADTPVIKSYTFTNPQTDVSYTRTTNGMYITASSAQPVTLTFSDGTTQTVTSGTYTIGRSMPITTAFSYYESLGGAHPATVTFEKSIVGTITYKDNDGNTVTDTATAWVGNLAKTKIDEEDGSTSTLSLSNTTLVFDSKGVLRTGTFTGTEGLSADGASAVPVDPVPTAIGSPVATSKLTATHTTPNGSETTEMTLDYNKVTQYAGMNTINATPDGHAAGSLKSVAIDSAGVITGTYTNGVVQSEAQVAIAQFANASGLTKTGSSLYQISNNSGTANIKRASDLGCTITPSALEMSNVDIANEFSDMIITQRGFQSNSKVITVGDEMLETLINMKR